MMISLGNFGYQEFLLGNCSWISLGSVGYVVGGFKHFLFSIIYIYILIYGIILPIDELIFFRGVGIPPTSVCFLGDSSVFLGG